MNPLTTIPARWRRRVYAGYAWLGLGIGATQVGYSAASVDQPVALTVALAVYAFVGGAIGAAAASNTPQGDGTA